MKGSKTKLECFVEAYLRQHNRNSLRAEGVRLLKKGRAYIEHIKAGGCCSDTTTIDLFTNKDNMFTTTIFQYLNQIEYDNNRASFDRTIDLINDFIVCCGANTL